MQHALVTGGAGFIGSHLVRALVAEGVQVRVLDNLASGDITNLDAVSKKIEFMEGDVRNAVACHNACRDVDVVFHLAAFVSVPQSVADPIQSDAINTGGTLNLLIAARDRGVKRFVFSSSAAVYGDATMIPTPEEALPNPTSPYGVQKLAGEHYTRNFWHLYGLPTLCLRYFNVYGPRQSPYSAYAAAIPRFALRLLNNEPIVIFGDGEQTRDFCAVQDVVAANLLAARTSQENAPGSIINIAGGYQISLNTLLNHLRKVTGREFTVQYTQERVGDIRHSGADIRRAGEILGYTPQSDLVEGLRQTFAYYKALTTK